MLAQYVNGMFRVWAHPCPCNQDQHEQQRQLHKKLDGIQQRASEKIVVHGSPHANGAAATPRRLRCCHHATPDSADTMPGRRIAHDKSWIMRTPMLAVCHSERTGAATTAGVPAVPMGDAGSDICNVATSETSNAGTSPAALAKSAASTRITISDGILVDAITSAPNSEPRPNSSRYTYVPLAL